MIIALLSAALFCAPPEAAEFTVSRDPTRVVLHVTESNMLMESRSATFYGDGRVVLITRLSPDAEQYETQISRDELERLMDIAVRTGLAEWDGMEINSRILAQRGGVAYLPPEDGSKVQILLSLESYSRKGFSAEGHERSIRVSSPHASAKTLASTIPELQGVVDILTTVHQLIAEAREQ